MVRNYLRNIERNQKRLYILNINEKDVIKSVLDLRCLFDYID